MMSFYSTLLLLFYLQVMCMNTMFERRFFRKRIIFLVTNRLISDFIPNVVHQKEHGFWKNAKGKEECQLMYFPLQLQRTLSQHKWLRSQVTSLQRTIFSSSNTDKKTKPVLSDRYLYGSILIFDIHNFHTLRQNINIYPSY